MGRSVRLRSIQLLGGGAGYQRGVLMRRLSILLPVVVVFSLVMLGCSSSDPSASVKANEEAYVEAFFAQDLDAFMDTFTDDVVFIDETYGDHFEGKAAVRSMYANVIKFADPDQSELIVGFVADDATSAASTWEWDGTNAFGNPFHLPTALIHEYRDGKIAKETVYYASPDAYGQLMGSGS
jgi:steroid delta-isomerase-like uncharacterized protein